MNVKNKKGPYPDVDSMMEGVDDDDNSASIDAQAPSRNPVAVRVMSKRPGPGGKGGDFINNLEAKADSYEKLMPVTKTLVRLKYMELDPKSLKVSRKNRRVQTLLDLAAVADIWPSIRKDGQTEPGLVRELPNGDMEVIAGSRRRFCAEAAGQLYKAWVGEIPDADVAALSKIENNYKKPSDYEKALGFSADIEEGIYINWDDVAKSENLANSTVSGYAALRDVDEVFIKAFADPNTFSGKNAKWVRSMCNKSPEIERVLKEEAEKIVRDKDKRIKTNTPQLLPAKVMSQFKLVVAKLAEADIPKPTKRTAVIYASPNNKKEAKHSISRDGITTKLELKGLTDNEIEKVVALIKSIGDMKAVK